MAGQRQSYAQEMVQANREARITVLCLILTIIVWCFLGFGLAPLDIRVFNLPLWILCGTVGTWVFAIIIAVVLSGVITDVDLDEESSAPVQAVAEEASADSDSLERASECAVRVGEVNCE